LRWQARTAGDGLPPTCFPVGDRLGHGEHRREVFLRDDDKAAGVATDHVPGTDGHPTAAGPYANPLADVEYMFARSGELETAPSISVFEPGFLRPTLAWQRSGRLPPGAMVKLYFGGDLEFGLRPTATALEAYLELLEPSGCRGRWRCSAATWWGAGWPSWPSAAAGMSGSGWRITRGRASRPTST
jgi:beta-keto acid cleavage enzyme